MSWPVLVADLGGTNVRFALADPAHAGLLQAQSVRRFRVDAFASMADAVRAYVDEVDTPVTHAVFAVAGRVERDRVQITNHPWLIEIGALRSQLGLDRLDVRNDFAVLAHAVPFLDSDAVQPLGGPVPDWRGDSDRCCVVLGPGTGLGVAAVLRREGRCHALASEGGHVAFAPGDALERAVLDRLLSRFERVSVERLLSGPGLVNVHRALAELDGVAAVVDATPEAIVAAAGAGQLRASQAMSVCARVLAGFAGDLVLAYGAWDGVYVTGGLAQALQPWLGRDEVRRRFEAKGRFASAMAQVPVALIVHPEVGLFAAATVACVDVDH